MPAAGVQFKLHPLFSDDTRVSRVGDADVAALQVNDFKKSHRDKTMIAIEFTAAVLFLSLAF